MHAMLAMFKAITTSHHGLPPRLLSLWLCAAVCLWLCAAVTADVVSVCCAVAVALAVAVGRYVVRFFSTRCSTWRVPSALVCTTLSAVIVHTMLSAASVCSTRVSVLLSVRVCVCSVV